MGNDGVRRISIAGAHLSCCLGSLVYDGDVFLGLPSFFLSSILFHVFEHTSSYLFMHLNIFHDYSSRIFVMCAVFMIQKQSLCIICHQHLCSTFKMSFRQISSNQVAPFSTVVIIFTEFQHFIPFLVSFPPFSTGFMHFVVFDHVTIFRQLSCKNMMSNDFKRVAVECLCCSPCFHNFNVMLYYKKLYVLRRSS